MASAAFSRHLAFFASPHSHSITLLSALKASLSLGLNFPVSLVLCVALRWMYKSPRAGYSRTMLEQGRVLDDDSFTRDQLVAMIPSGERTWMNQGHVFGLWALSAGLNGRVSRDDVLKIRDGSLMESIKDRRRVGRSRDVVLPFRRGGPGNVAGHSWAVGKIFGVPVYLEEDDKKQY